MGPGFQEISLHSSRTDRPLKRVCLKDLGRRLEPWEDPKTNNSVPLCETFTKKSNKKARQQGHAYLCISNCDTPVALKGKVFETGQKSPQITKILNLMSLHTNINTHHSLLEYNISPLTALINSSFQTKRA